MSENGSHASCPYSYTVKQGDSYYRIAQRTGVRLRDPAGGQHQYSACRADGGRCVPYCRDAQTPAQENGAASGSACPPNRRAVV